METSERTRRVVNPGTSIGHVHLKVANIERALGFYRDILGFEVMQWYGDDAVFLSAGGYHHHIGLNTWMSRNAGPGPDPFCRALPPRHPLPRAARPRAGLEVAPGVRVPRRWCLGPRRIRGPVPARPRRQRRRAVSRPPARRVATYRRRGTRDGHPPTRCGRFAERAGMKKGAAFVPLPLYRTGCARFLITSSGAGPCICRGRAPCPCPCPGPPSWSGRTSGWRGRPRRTSGPAPCSTGCRCRRTPGGSTDRRRRRRYRRRWPPPRRVLMPSAPVNRPPAGMPTLMKAS